MLSRAEDRASTWKSVLNSNHDPILQVGNHHKRELVEKKPNLLLQRHANPAPRKVLRRRNVLSNPVCYLIETFFREKGSGVAFFPTHVIWKMFFQPKSLNLVMRLGRRCDQDKEIRLDKIAKCFLAV